MFHVRTRNTCTGHSSHYESRIHVAVHGLTRALGSHLPNEVTPPRLATTYPTPCNVHTMHM